MRDWNTMDERTRKQAGFVFAAKVFASSRQRNIVNWLDAFEKPLDWSMFRWTSFWAWLRKLSGSVTWTIVMVL